MVVDTTATPAAAPIERPKRPGLLLLGSGHFVVDGAWGIVALAAAGFILMASFSATVVMGREYMPHRLALAAAWVLGFAAIGSATPWLPAIGAIADAAGRETALWVLAALPIAAAAVAAFLPRPTGARG